MSTFWLRADMKREFVGGGCDNALKNHIKHSWEGLYCWRNGYKGLMGYPVKLLGGVSYDLGETSTLSVSTELGDSYTINSGMTHKLDKNWSVGIEQRFNSALAGKDGKPYDIGFNMTYKL